MSSSISKTFWITFATTVAFVLVGYVLAWVGPQNPSAASREVVELLLPSALVTPQPKPGDRFVFMGLVLSVPIVLLAAMVLARKINLETPEPFALVLPLLAAIVLIGAWKGAGGAALASFQSFPVHFVAAAATAALVVIGSLSGSPMVRRRAFILALALAVFITLGLRVWTGNNVHYMSWFTSHGEAVLFAIVRIATGDTCLAEALPQYGCHGEFLAPILKLMGLSVFNLTALLAILQIAAIFSAFTFVTAIIRAPVLVSGAIAALFSFVVLNLLPGNPDPILQYYPIRFLFPALSLVVARYFQSCRGPRRAFIAGAFGGAAIGWNLESGLATFLALTIFCAASGFDYQGDDVIGKIKQQAERALSALAGGALFVALFLGYLTLKSAEPISIQNYFIFQTTFYFTGFGMILTPSFPDWWTIHASIVLATLLYAALIATRHLTLDRETELASYLAILGIGLSLYYTGRSHDLVLKLVAWPSAILLFFLFDRLTHALPNFAQGRARLASAVLASLPTLYFALQLPAVWRLTTLPRTGALQSELHEDLAFIRAHVTAGERVMILGFDQWALYMQSGTRPALPGPSVAEMIRVEDLASLQAALLKKGPRTVFLAPDLAIASQKGWLGTDLRFDVEMLGAAYALTEWGPAKRLMLLQRKP